MPSRSKAQFGMMGLLYSKGKISRKQLEDFNKGVHPGDLPEHVGKAAKKRRKKKRRHDTVSALRGGLSKAFKK